jgi:HAD superfamily hydrolase (TIGR01509 family)
MKKRVVIFDMDGLMFDTERLACTMWKKAGAENGYTIPDSFFPSIIGSNTVETERIFKQRFGRDFPYQRLRKIRLDYTDRFLQDEGVPVKKGLLPLLDILTENNIKKAVATSTEKGRARENLTLAGILEKFDCLVGGDDVTKSKPEPDIFLEAARQLHTRPSSCIVLEDSEKGIAVALAAGMVPVMVPDIIPPPSWVAEKNIHVCASLEEATPLVKILLEF